MKDIETSSMNNNIVAPVTYIPGCIRLSDIGYSQPAHTVHPHAAAVNQELRDWTMQMVCPLGLHLEKYINEYNTMASYVFPRASAERLQVIGKLSNLQYVHDDIIDGRRLGNATGIYAEALRSLKKQPALFIAGCRDILTVLATGKTPTDVKYGPEVSKLLLLDYYQEAALGFRSMSNPQWLRRFAKNLKIFYESQVSSSTKPSEFGSCAEFVEFRSANSGMLHSVDEVEFAMNTYMPDEILENRVIKEMQQCVVLVGSLSNDIFSFEKETIRDRMYHANLVHVAMTTENLTVELASRRTADIVRANVETFQRLQEEVETWGMPNVSQYCCGLEDFLLGCWPWQMSTSRYRSPTSPFAELLIVSKAPRIRPRRSQSAPSVCDLRHVGPVIMSPSLRAARKALNFQ